MALVALVVLVVFLAATPTVHLVLGVTALDALDQGVTLRDLTWIAMAVVLMAAVLRTEWEGAPLDLRSALLVHLATSTAPEAATGMLTRLAATRESHGDDEDVPLAPRSNNDALRAHRTAPAVLTGGLSRFQATMRGGAGPPPDAFRRRPRGG